MRKTIKASIESLVSKYSIQSDNIIQFIFYTFPISINGAIVIGETNLDITTFDNFSDKVHSAMRKAAREGKIDMIKADSSSDINYTVYNYIFKVLFDDGTAAETVCCMLRIALHEWGEPGKSMTDSEKEIIRRREIDEHAPKKIGNSECIIVDNGYIVDPNTGELGDFKYKEALIEVVSDPNVEVLTLEQAQNRLETKLKTEWNLDLEIKW